MKRNKIYIENIFFLVIAIYIAFLQLFSEDILFYGLFLLFLFLFVCNGIEIRKNKLLLWGIPILYMVFSICYTYSVDSGIKYSVVIIICWFIGVVLSNTDDWGRRFYKNLVPILGIHVMFTLFSIVFKEVALETSKWILPSDIYNMTARWVRENGNFAGISGQTVTNALFFSILLGISVSGILVKGKTVARVVACVMLLGLLFATGKKAAVAACFLAVLAIAVMKYKSQGKKLKIPIIIITVFILIAIIVFVSLGHEKLEALMGTSVISRIRILKNVQVIFEKNPFWGSGIDSVAFFVGHSAHNNFVQLLCEYGMIGCTLFICVIGCVLIDVVIKSYYCLNDRNIERTEKVMVLFAVYYQVYFLLTGFFESTLFNYRMVLVYFITIAGVYSVERKRERTINT